MSEEATASNNVRDDIGDGSDALDRCREKALGGAIFIGALLLALSAIGIAVVCLIKLAPIAF